MARESRRKREERRWGRPERLADLCVQNPPDRWKINHTISALLTAQPDEKPGVMTRIEQLKKEIAAAPKLVADNVADFFCMHQKNEWDFLTDFPCCAPPFKSTWIEWNYPPVIVVDGGETVAWEAGKKQWGSGVFIETVKAEAANHQYAHVDDNGRLVMEIIPEAEWLAFFHIVGNDGGYPVYAGSRRWTCISKSGLILRRPSGSYEGGQVSPFSMQQLASSTQLQMFIACLTLCFLNCKNTMLTQSTLDERIARERKKAGLRPFVRYHTINIEPMKRVLKTEGNIETEGLKKALHICRGHFATYSEERPLFGKHAGTFWVPAHTRGSLKSGVVVSDYNVKAPKGGDS